MNEAHEPITLRLTGSRAERGISLSDFETFIESFIAAVRDFDRDRLGKETRKTGHPEARAQRVAAFRLIGFREGSAVAVLEPDLPRTEDAETERLLDAEPLQVENLRALVGACQREEELPRSVSDALKRMVQSGGEDARLSVELGGSDDRGSQTAVVIDLDRIRRIRAAHPPAPPQPVTSISGHLHQVDFEPDKMAIRASDGVDWVCSFPEALEARVAALVRRVVWARGSGELQSPRRGTMEVREIRAAEQGMQSDLFSSEALDEDRLAAAQGIKGPQGLEALGVDEWDEDDDAYLAALTEK